mmetsp:Transcript_34398/g.63279  ORF Transcript_34398/g.63279 Transcript_34398/m.63279 type:complete len:208 (+) Transcript_34398:98-721(+)
MRLTLPLSLFIHASSISGAFSFNRPCFVTPKHMSVSSAKLSLPSCPWLPDHLGPRSSSTNNLQRMFLSGDGSEDQEEQPPTLTNIGKADMTEILSHVENGTGDKNYVVIDVRGVDEIMMSTGTMSEKVHILPLPQITMMAAFDMDEKSFEAQFNFPKPNAEDTLVFTCQMGGRSQQAAQLAATSGYKTIINYTGGADDWFGGEFVYT